MSPEAAKNQARTLCEADRAAWLTTQPFLAHLALQVEIVPVVDPRVQTAATDGRSVFCSASFMLGLSEADRRFVLAHEVWHCALSHIPRREGREALRWNVAVDHEVNALLQDEGLIVPKGCILFSQWTELPAEEVYERLPPILVDRGRFADLHGLDELEVLAGDPDFRPVANGFVGWPERLRMAASAAALQGGHVPLGAGLLIERFGKPTLPWRDVLARFVASCRSDNRSWSRPSRRGVALGLHLPGRLRGNPRLAVGIDASGSCIMELADFLAELRGAVIATGEDRVRMLVFDAAVQMDEDVGLSALDQPGGLTMRGGGGTDFRPLLERLAASTHELDGVVILTDGYGAVPKRPPAFPVLWVLTAGGSAPASWATCIQMPQRQQKPGMRQIEGLVSRPGTPSHQ